MSRHDDCGLWLAVVGWSSSFTLHWFALARMACCHLRGVSLVSGASDGRTDGRKLIQLSSAGVRCQVRHTSSASEFTDSPSPLLASIHHRCSRGISVHMPHPPPPPPPPLADRMTSSDDRFAPRKNGEITQWSGKINFIESSVNTQEVRNAELNTRSYTS